MDSTHISTPAVSTAQANGIVVLLAAPAVLSLLLARRAGTVTDLAEVGRLSAMQTAVSAERHVSH